MIRPAIRISRGACAKRLVVESAEVRCGFPRCMARFEIVGINRTAGFFELGELLPPHFNLFASYSSSDLFLVRH